MIEFLAATSIAIAAIALLRPLVRPRFGAVAVLQLWWLLPVALAAVMVPKEVVHEAVLAPAAQAAAAPVESLPLQHGIPWITILATLWLAGSAAMAAWYCWLHHRFARLIEWRGRIGTLPAMHAPAVVGAWRPRLVLPRDFAKQFDAPERRLVLLHERVHMRRRDGAANLLMAALTVLQWFNPLLHWAGRALRRDQESACDAIVIQRNPQAAGRYASALLKAVPQPHAAPTACTWNDTHPVVERIGMLKTHRDLRPRPSLAAAVLVGSAALVSALAYAAKPETPVAVIAQAPAPTAPTPAPPASGASYSSAALKVTSMRLVDENVIVEMLVEDTQNLTVLARPRLLVKPGKPFGISLGRNADVLDLSGTIEKEIAADGREYLRYRVEATPKSSGYFFSTGTWPVAAQDRGS